MSTQLSSIETAIKAIAAGRPVIVADDEDRENEGDVILSAHLATPETIGWTVAHSSGLLCAPMTDEIADRLDLPMMVTHNQDVRATAYTVTVDAAQGVTTGISASDRAHTLNVLANPESAATDVNRPGHILPLRAVSGGVRQRPGHTEAGVELMKLAGLPEVAVIAEIVADDGEMMRLPELIKLGAAEDVPVITIEALIEYLNIHQPMSAAEATILEADSSAAAHRRISLRADTHVPTRWGQLRMMVFRDRRAGVEHMVISNLAETDSLDSPVLTRVHSECLTGEVFGSLKCECGPQLDASLEMIAEQGGVLVYLRGHEGRGIGLGNKLRAYALQHEGLDTVDANVELGFEVDARDYRAAAEMLQHLGIQQVDLLTNNPAKVRALKDYSVHVNKTIPLLVGAQADNLDYLHTKRDRMDHLIPADL